MTVLTDIVCPFCGCLCDDLEVTIEDNHIRGIKNACTVSRSKFLNHSKNRLEATTIDGEPVSLEEALDAAVDILSGARRPLVYGLSSTECEAIGKAVEITELIGGIIDNTSSVCHGPTILALQQVGESKTTLGEVKNRSDLIIFWGSNPTQAHIRHLSRYSGMPKGLYTSEGRKNRYLVAVDIRETPTAKMADQFIKI
jgi:formylmethanofuran dehydrogenase subunit B